MEVVTLTLNPAFDIHVEAKEFEIGQEVIGDVKSFESGGKGINVSKALSENGVSNRAVLLVGNKNGDSFINGIDATNINIDPIYVNGSIRENITIHSTGNLETRLSFKGLDANDEIFDEVQERLGGLDDGSILVVSGSFPPGISTSLVKKMIINLRNKGVRIVLDSRSFSLEDILDIRPWLIKPNMPELRQYFKNDELTVGEACAIAKRLNGEKIENVIISMDEHGSVLANGGILYRANVPKIECISSIGAGDSTIAGFIKSEIDGLDAVEKIRLASAFGTAKCLRGGTIPPLKEDIEEIRKRIIVERMS